jgi:hypothetical protein
VPLPRCHMHVASNGGGRLGFRLMIRAASGSYGPSRRILQVTLHVGDARQLRIESASSSFFPHILEHAVECFAPCFRVTCGESLWPAMHFPR